ncbi:GGDEF domain-containing protein [Altererythrobacter sp. CC-YST694]|uniref:GGDEF domain-containing protein n=1 Tax=Altererythrobacter sp. CC-YST694 TaxID=2755038 RepID=UPI001D032847|nr:GGDEF domain-containing protein [Altererythrobacter sp. CC-YST694]MCB5424876.1 GGDEF domain-containing protein [Altererythrobacter sp. CC-YST694]
MGRKHAIEQRAKVEAGFSERRGIAFRITQAQAWIAVCAGIALTSLVDYATGRDLWLGPLYLGFIALAAWALGLRRAIAVFGVCILIGAVVNADSLYPYDNPVTLADFLVRIPPVLAIIALLSYARHACETEWRLARTDPLTGALNRKAFFEMAGPIREAQCWHVLAYADLDGLKALNDIHGHARGDASLKAFARHVRASIRRDDIFARIGGDEFLVYMPVRDSQAGIMVANRLHRAMNSAVSDFADELRCSVGALILAPGARSIDQELRLADKLMYEAKQNGAALTMAMTSPDGRGFADATDSLPLFAGIAEDLPSSAEFRQTSRDDNSRPGGSSEQPGPPPPLKAA